MTTEHGEPTSTSASCTSQITTEAPWPRVESPPTHRAKLPESMTNIELVLAATAQRAGSAVLA